ncbi:MAG: hypothetical protein R3322_10590, partial [Kiloniellales bacterium]|nr:hypothetical protein [Kiloniellales bacterium]
MSVAREGDNAGGAGEAFPLDFRDALVARHGGYGIPPPKEIAARRQGRGAGARSWRVVRSAPPG